MTSICSLRSTPRNTASKGQSPQISSVCQPVTQNWLTGQGNRNTAMTLYGMSYASFRTCSFQFLINAVLNLGFQETFNLNQAVRSAIQVHCRLNQDSLLSLSSLAPMLSSTHTCFCHLGTSTSVPKEDTKPWSN